ncbi:hypothetical protein C8R47DRAFT_1250446 [Mycena vitilis]|nr:hypothetical protein C8R47DRAFT_1250446 [Mycena vitilis]
MPRRKTEMGCSEGTLPRGHHHFQKEFNEAMAELRQGGGLKLPTGDPRLKRTTSQTREASSANTDSITADADVATLEAEMEVAAPEVASSAAASYTSTDSMAFDVEVAVLEAETNRAVDLMRGERYANFDFAIPTMHAAAHRTQCFLVYDYSVCPFVDPREEAENDLARLWTRALTIGQEPRSHVDGEQVERAWADLAPVAASTRMMPPGRRHDAVLFSEAKL